MKVALFAAAAVGAGWLWHVRRNVLAYLVPIALTFPPIFAYGAHAFGWPGGWVSTRKALVACILVFVISRLIRRDASYRRVPGAWFIMPYALLVMASVLWGVFAVYSDDVGAVAGELGGWALPVVIFLLVAGSFWDEAALTRATRVLVVVSVVAAVYAGLQALVMIGIDRIVPAPIVALTQYGRQDLDFGPLRVYGTLANLGPNFFGAFLLVPTLLALTRALAGRALIRVMWLVAGLACMAAIMGTYSRGAMLGLCVALVVLPFWRRSARGFLLMVGAVVSIGLVVAQTPIGQHAADLYVGGQLDVSSSARMDLWRHIAKSSATHPFGMGFNSWPRVSRVHADIGYEDPPSSIGTERPAENQWMRELADRGIPGVLALALLMGGIIIVTYRAADPLRSDGYARDILTAVGAGAVGWVVVFVTGDHLMYDNVGGMFWYTTALALAASRDARRVPGAQAAKWAQPLPAGHTELQAI